MPKKVFDAFLRELRRDIKMNYKEDDRYLTMRQIAQVFQVSLQTAQKGIAYLESEGIVKSKKKSGIFIESLESKGSTKGKHLVVLSNKQDQRFYNVFFNGVKQRLNDTEISLELIVNPHTSTDTLAFGDYLVSLKADGIIALSFDKAALPFYHAMREGIDIVSDIIIDQLPNLPAVQTNNYKHAFDAGEILLQNEYRDFFVFGYFPENNKRYKGFYDAVKSRARSVTYIHLSDIEAMAKTDAIFHNLSKTTAIFSCDYSANYILASQFLKHNVKISAFNFLAYDSELDFFHYPGLPPIRCVAPSFFNLGEALAKMILEKWEKGVFSLPLQQKL
jgi:DNA-binding LacI/PurR family transcriptional regulator